MKRVIERKSEIHSLIHFLFAIVGLVLFLRLFVGYKSPGFYYHPVSEWEKEIEYAVGRISVLTYFSYLSFFFNIIWGLLFFFSTAINSKKLFDFLNNKYTLTFITINQIVTMVVYFVSQIFSPIPFNFTSPDLNGFINFSVGSYIHFVMPISIIVYFLVVAKPKNLELKKCVWFLIFPLAYAIMVKVLGEFVYKHEWYPYPIFSVEAISNLLFKSTSNINVPLAITLISLCCIFVAGVYFLLILLICKFSNRQIKNKNK